MSALGKIIFYSMIALIIIFSAIIILILSLAFSSSSAVLSSNTAPIANLGQDTLLSCYLLTQTVTKVSVTWEKKDLSGVVYKYKNGAANLQDQNSQFKGRTQLFSEALVTGNASLLLRNVRQSDEGEYTCILSSSHSGGTVNIHLRTAAFTAPTFTLSNSVLTAHAGRWFPKPNVTWLNLDDEVLQGNTTILVSPKKIYSVWSTVPVTSTDSYICRIENDLVISVSTATVTGSAVSEESYFTFSAASSLLVSVHLSITVTGVLFIYNLT
ncbi:V-set domain-containing T-cell activation inhibitor 1 isoform X1 [Hippoglossus stenolepis]|uniref:V-set domain-containing T-cell activation inhibitor 1 isoform X1 n=2 Tax=Hippoglossus stenolepis TaxID=195615 RepID=UPI00159CB654|nr:V-set domain-containing T-cell activation inhibitor 1 isoform X1 [Hippoglossus stenolepis]